MSTASLGKCCLPVSRPVTALLSMLPALAIERYVSSARLLCTRWFQTAGTSVWDVPGAWYGDGALSLRCRFLHTLSCKL